jgi:hypothetical protein
VEAGLIGFAYTEGFAQAVEHYLEGGWEALERAMTAGSTSAILHPERAGFSPEPFPEPSPPEPGLELADEDTLGEQAIIVLVSVLSGKDNLGLMAGDGWAGDRLYRWEPAGETDGSRGMTVWLTKWLTEEDAADFEYALWRTLKERFPGQEPAALEGGGKSLTGGGRRFLVERSGKKVHLAIGPAG